MSEGQKQANRGTATVWLAIAFLLASVAYVLSLGPFRWLLVHGYLDGYVDAVQIYFGPLNFVADQCPPIMKLLRWYADLWGPMP